MADGPREVSNKFDLAPIQYAGRGLKLSPEVSTWAAQVWVIAFRREVRLARDVKQYPTTAAPCVALLPAAFPYRKVCRETHRRQLHSRRCEFRYRLPRS